MFRKLFTATLIVAAAAGASSCAMPAVQRATAIPNPAGAKYNYADPADDCPPGDIITANGEDPGCDVNAGNRWIVTDMSVEECNHAGGKHDGDDACVGVDF